MYYFLIGRRVILRMLALLLEGHGGDAVLIFRRGFEFLVKFSLDDFGVGSKFFGQVRTFDLDLL